MCGIFQPVFFGKMDFSVIFVVEILHIFLRKFFKLQYLRNQQSELTFLKNLDRCQEFNLNTYRSGISGKQFGGHGSAKKFDGKA